MQVKTGLESGVYRREFALWYGYWDTIISDKVLDARNH
jgi:hypothetical protein